MGIGLSVEELVLLRARQAVAAGCDGVIASGLEARRYAPRSARGR